MRCSGACGDVLQRIATPIAATTSAYGRRRCLSTSSQCHRLLTRPYLTHGRPSPTFRGRSRDQHEWLTKGGANVFNAPLRRPGFDSHQRLTHSSSRNSVSSPSLSSSKPSDIGARSDASHEPIDDISRAGSVSFQKYTDTKERIRTLRADMERTKSIQLYRAWESAEDKAKEEKERKGKTAARRGGVAVVKTLVRQVNEEAQMQDRVLRNLQELETDAQRFLEEAALQHRHPQALLVLGNQCLEERGDPHRAMELWKLSGTGTGWFNVGHMLWTGYEPEDSTSSNVPPVPVDQAEAMRAFERAVELGDADAMYFVGVEKLSELSDENSSGNHLPSAADLRSGLGCLERAVELGHGGAMYYLALLHLQGSDRLNIPACEDAEFARRLNQACDVGQHPEAWFLRGHCYYHGDHSYPRNVRKALEDFLRAADAGHADSAVSAGAILFQGAEGTAGVGSEDGVPRDRRRAFELYQHAGELGSLDGWRNVVACYATGQGVPQSLETAQYIAKTMLPPEKDE